MRFDALVRMLVLAVFYPFAAVYWCLLANICITNYYYYHFVVIHMMRIGSCGIRALNLAAHHALIGMGRSVS